ncbi:hypothetical protein HPB48_022708 [Haemaphysalis longicornis]|uniref:Uncharacterized protein n=1 Tax=Haemaphysalis longicornis TaxID=44386 RepID=A0A9J6FVQ5_HAELO|nr:hypothetical protein HPB48_022708 [Haemaphysalis longicornis]
MGSSTLTQLTFHGSRIPQQVTFHGSRVPHWIRYHTVTLRCSPLKRKTVACLRCWTFGHGADVCRSPEVDNRCTISGTLNPSPQHTCHPRCILCSGTHPTGDPACPQRYPRPPSTRRRIIVGRYNPALSAPQGNPLSTKTANLTSRLHQTDSGIHFQPSTFMQATKPPPRTSPGRPVSQDSATPTYPQMSAPGHTPIRHPASPPQHFPPLPKHQSPLTARDTSNANGQLLQTKTSELMQELLNLPTNAPPAKRQAADPSLLTIPQLTCSHRGFGSPVTIPSLYHHQPH